MTIIHTTPRPDLMPKAHQVDLRITGSTPLLMHNPRLADKLDEYTKAITEVTDGSKGKNPRLAPEEASAMKSRLQFLGGLYWDPTAGVHLPGYNVFRSIYEGASALGRLGTKYDAAVIDYTDLCPIEPYAAKYDDPEAVFTDGHFLRTNVKIGQSMVMSTRPMFTQWETTFMAVIDTESLGVDQFVAAATLAGRTKGVGDGRTKGYRKGRYDVEVIG